MMHVYSSFHLRCVFLTHTSLRKRNKCVRGKLSPQCLYINMCWFSHLNACFYVQILSNEKKNLLLFLNMFMLCVYLMLLWSSWRHTCTLFARVSRSTGLVPVTAARRRARTNSGSACGTCDVILRLYGKKTISYIIERLISYLETLLKVNVNALRFHSHV